MLQEFMNLLLLLLLLFEIADFNSNNEFSKKLIFWFMFVIYYKACFNFVEISDSQFWFWLKLKFQISNFKFELYNLFYIIYMLIARLMSFELMLWICIKWIIWMYFN